LLDEPVLGLDANHRDLFYKVLIEKYSQSPCTIVISIHLIEEVSNIIENIVHPQALTAGPDNSGPQD